MWNELFSVSLSQSPTEGINLAVTQMIVVDHHVRFEEMFQKLSKPENVQPVIAFGFLRHAPSEI